MLKTKDILFRDNITFPDNGLLDLKIGGHPTINVTEDIEGEIFFFRMSSNIAQYIQNKDSMELIQPNRHNGLSRPSVAKMDHILKEDYRNISAIGNLNESVFNKIINKFNYYRSEHSCDCKHCACEEYLILEKTKE